jgi:hypothetical protein
LASPLARAVAVTPDDTNELAEVTRALHCSVSGNAVVILQGDTAAVTLYLVAGALYPYRIKKVLATGTTATVHAMF